MGCFVAERTFGLNILALDLVIIGWKLVGIGGWIWDKSLDCKGNEWLSCESDDCDGTCWNDDCWDVAGDRDATSCDEDTIEDAGVRWKVGNGRINAGVDANTTYCGSDEKWSFCSSWKHLLPSSFDEHMV